MKLSLAVFDEMALNPIVVKELRQVTRSRYLTGIVLLYLLIMVVTLGMFVLGKAFERDVDFGAGRTMFAILLPMLNVACLLFVPAYAGMRMANERSDTNTDLLFTTALTPGAIVRGKLMAGVVMTILLYSMSVPFMVFTYLLRGIDILTMAVVLVPMFLVSVLAVQAALFVSVAPVSKPFKSLLGLWLVGMLVSILIGGSAIVMETSRSGFGGTFDTWDFWGPALSVLAGGMILFMLLYSFTVALIMPAAANRALPVRSACIAAWIVAGIVLACRAWVEDTPFPLMFWMIPSVGTFAIMLLFAISEIDTLRLRVRRAVPRRRILRPAAFLLYSGAAGGIFLSCIGALASFVVTWIPVSLGTWPVATKKDISDMREVLLSMGAMYLYILAYCMAAVLIRRFVYKDRLDRKFTMLTALAMMAFGALGPSMIGLLRVMDKPFKVSIGLWQIGNIGAVFDAQFRLMHLEVASAAALIMVVLNARWLFRQMREFMNADQGEPAIGSQ